MLASNILGHRRLLPSTEARLLYDRSRIEAVHRRDDAQRAQDLRVRRNRGGLLHRHRHRDLGHEQPARREEGDADGVELRLVLELDGQVDERDCPRAKREHRTVERQPAWSADTHETERSPEDDHRVCGAVGWK